MALPLLALGALLSFSNPLPPAAATPERQQTPGRPVPEDASRRSRNGFSGLLLVTPDADWRQQWQTPPGVMPRFHTTDQVSPGQRVTVLILLAHPEVDAGGVATVTCDIRVTRPDGTRSQDRQGLACLRGRLDGKPYDVRLAGPVVDFVGLPEDPPGLWQVEVVLHDTVRGTDLPLRTSFVLLSAASTGAPNV